MIYNITRYLNILAIICYNEKQHRELDNTSKERNQCGTILRANPNPSRLSLETAPSCSQVSLLARLPSSQSRRTPLRHLFRHWYVPTRSPLNPAWLLARCLTSKNYNCAANRTTRSPVSSQP